MLGPAHKPGALPLRPLGLSDIYDAAFKIIRFNPKATVGSAVLVTAVSMAIPVIVTAALTASLDLSMDPSTEMSSVDTAGMIGAFGSLALGSILQGIGLVLVTGMIAHVAAAAAIGRRLSLGEAWAATRGKRWRLIGLTFVLGLLTTLVIGMYVGAWVAMVVLFDGWPLVVFGLVTVPLFLCFLSWFWVRVYYLPVPPLMLEPVGIFGAIGRGYRLSSKQFWRIFGIALLTLLIAQIAGGMLSAPFALIGPVLLVGSSGEASLLVTIASNSLGTVVAAAFVAPFTTTVAALQYLDQRMRKEAYDIELMTQAGITGS